MRAPRRDSDEIDFAEGLRAARRMVAAVVLQESPPPTVSGRPVPGWQAWLFTAWLLIVAAAYGAHWLGLY